MFFFNMSDQTNAVPVHIETMAHVHKVDSFLLVLIFLLSNSNPPLKPPPSHTSPLEICARSSLQIIFQFNGRK